MVEGIYINTGEVAPLRSLYELKERYRFRLILDESVSLGVLGPTGRGAWEEAGLSVGDVDIIAASMGAGGWGWGVGGCVAFCLLLVLLCCLLCRLLCCLLCCLLCFPGQYSEGLLHRMALRVYLFRCC